MKGGALRTLRARDRLLVFSPHFDDAVLSCGELIARHPGAEVLTVFSAAPEGYPGVTDWDAACGFQNAQQSIAARVQEDDAALSLLSARPSRLNFFDSQYQATPTQQELVDRLDQVLKPSTADVVLMPAGLFHSDHVLLHQALLEVRQRHPKRRWMLYEDALYRRIPGLLQRRMAELCQAGVHVTPMDCTRDDAFFSLKKRAIACYASQLRGLNAAANGHADAFLPERYWILEEGAAVRR
jgi:LmbE family N-acetylglucosaminyl deacetylase